MVDLLKHEIHKPIFLLWFQINKEILNAENMFRPVSVFSVKILKDRMIVFFRQSCRLHIGWDLIKEFLSVGLFIINDLHSIFLSLDWSDRSNNIWEYSEPD